MLAIIAMTAGAVALNFRAPDGRLELAAATRTLCAGLNHARGRAIADNADRVVTVDVAASRYQVLDDAPVALPSGVRVSVTFASAERRASGEGVFRFYPNGEATGGEIVLERGNVRSAIIVNWLTGEARCAG